MYSAFNCTEMLVFVPFFKGAHGEMDVVHAHDSDFYLVCILHNSTQSRSETMSRRILRFCAFLAGGVKASAVNDSTHRTQ